MTSDENPDIAELPDDALEQVVEPGLSVIDTAVAAARSDDFQSLIALFERELDGDESKERQALLQHEIGELQETRLGDESEAVKTYAKALHLDPTLRPNVWAIRRVFWGRSLWPNLLKLIDVEIRFARTDGERADLWLERGQILEDKVNDVAGAREAYGKAREASPEHLGPLMALERLCTREGDLPVLAEDVLPALARATPEPARKVAILLELARLRETLDGAEAGPDRVLAVLEDAYAVGVERARVLDELERVAQGAQLRDEVLRVWERRLELRAAEPPAEGEAALRRARETAAIRRRQAQLAREGADLPRAWDYLAQALAACPDDPLLLLEQGDLAARLGRTEDLAAVLIRRVAGLPADDPRRLGLTFQRALLALGLGRADEAEALFAAIAQEQPAYLPLLQVRERRAAAAGDHGALADLYAQLAAAVTAGTAGLPALPPGGDPAWAAALHVMRAEILQHRLGRDADAEAAYQAALGCVRHYRPAVDGLEILLMRGGRWTDLAALLEGELDGAAAERLDYLLELLTRVARDRLGDRERALGYLRRLADLHPGDPRAMRRLCDGLVACGQWAEVVETNARLAADLGDEVRAAPLRLDSAQICDEELHDAGRAVEQLGRVLEATPGHPLAAAALEHILRREHRFDELIAALQREVEATLDQGRITALLFKIGVIYERELGKPEEAARIYRDILDRSPGYAPAVRALANAYRVAGDAARLAGALEAEVELIATPAAKAVALVELGELYEERLSQDDTAEDAYARALAQQPGFLPAALGQLRVLARRKDCGRFGATCAEVAAALGDDPARAAFLEEAAQMAGRPDGDPDGAAELWAGVRAAAPGRLAPLLAQARAAARQGVSAPLGDAQAALGAALGGTLGAALGARAAVVAEVTGAADEGAAIAGARYRAALEAVPGYAPALVPLCDLPPPSATPEHLARRAGLAAGVDRVEILLERGEMLEEAGRLKDAVQALGEVLAASPDHPGAVEALRRIAARAGDLDGQARAAARLGALLRDPARGAAAYREAAAIVDAKLARPADAAPLWRQVLEREPEDAAAYTRLHQLLVAAGDDASLHELLSHRLRHAPDGGTRVPLLVERAELRIRRLADRAGAVRDLRQVLDITPDHHGSLRQLGFLLAEDGAYRPALDMLERYLGSTDDPALLVPVLLKIAEIQDVALAAPDEAIGTLERAVDLAPAEAAAYERLAAVHLKKGAHEQAIETLRQLGHRRDDPSARARLEIRIAEIHRDGLKDLDAAAKALERARALEPLCLEALGPLLRIHEEQRNPSSRKLLLEQSVSLVRDALAQSPLKLELYGTLARLLEWSGEADGRFFAAQAQAFFNAASEPDRELLMRAGTRPFAPSRDLSPESWRNRLSHMRARGVAMEVWATIANAVRQLYPQDLASYNVGKGDRINLKSQGSEWPTLERIGRAFGVSGFELYLTRAQSELVAVVPGDPPALVVGAALGGAPGPALRFKLGRAFALLRDRTAAVLSLPEEDLRLIFAAAAQIAGGEVGYAVPAGRVEERAKALAKAMARKERNAIAVLGSRMGHQLGDPRDFHTGVQLTAARAGLLAAGDLQAALTELAPHLGAAAQRAGKPAAELTAAFGAPVDGLDVLLYAVSSDHLALRAELGLAPSRE
ncbi:MAG TPA: tetratricopeptide repeat protein [Polyangia bacterium]|jgi:tetratricopeptide (TPR) repeat protein